MTREEEKRASAYWLFDFFFLSSENSRLVERALGQIGSSRTIPGSLHILMAPSLSPSLFGTYFKVGGAYIPFKLKQGGGRTGRNAPPYPRSMKIKNDTAKTSLWALPACLATMLAGGAGVL